MSEWVSDLFEFRRCSSARSTLGQRLRRCPSVERALDRRPARARFEAGAVTVKTVVWCLFQLWEGRSTLTPTLTCVSVLQQYSEDASPQLSIPGSLVSSPWPTATPSTDTPTCPASSRCFCGRSRTPPAGTVSACSPTTSWESRTFASWPHGCCSAPWSGRGISRFSRTSRWRTRSPCSASAGANCSCWTRPSAPCRSTWPRYWRRRGFTPVPWPRTGWWPSWTTYASFRNRWRNWNPYTSTPQSTAA